MNLKLRCPPGIEGVLPSGSGNLRRLRPRPNSCHNGREEILGHRVEADCGASRCEPVSFQAHDLEPGVQKPGADFDATDHGDEIAVHVDLVTALFQNPDLVGRRPDQLLDLPVEEPLVGWRDDDKREGHPLRLQRLEEGAVRGRHVGIGDDRPGPRSLRLFERGKADRDLTTQEDVCGSRSIAGLRGSSSPWFSPPGGRTPKTAAPRRHRGRRASWASDPASLVGGVLLSASDPADGHDARLASDGPLCPLVYLWPYWLR